MKSRFSSRVHRKIVSTAPFQDSCSKESEATCQMMWESRKQWAVLTAPTGEPVGFWLEWLFDIAKGNLSIDASGIQ